MSATQTRPDAGTGDGMIHLDRRVQVQPADLLPDTYRGAGYDYRPLGIYGGHLLGQGLAAAFHTVPEPKLAHSLHAHFLKTGQPNAAIGYSVERLRDGRSYTTRLVRAVQGEQTLMLMTASFKLAEPGDEHQPPMPEVRSAAALERRRKAAGQPPLVMPFSGVCGVELVPTEGRQPFAGPAERPALALWMRAALSAGASPRARQCALAYLSDGTLMFNALRPHGTAFHSHRATSLDHAVWFHRDVDPGEWLLFDQTGPVAADSRGLNHGSIFDPRGRLVASVAQESMMRRRVPARGRIRGGRRV